MKFIKRETDILKALKTLVETRVDFVVVGGFAVSGLTRHRFSVDCDVVVARRELEKLERILEREGFTKHVERAGFDEVYGGEFTSYKKEVEKVPVTFDLLVGSLVCRATDAAWSFDYIKKHSIHATIAGIETSVTCRVPEKELLIALKIHSARKADIRDVVMLRERADFEKVLKHLRKGREEALRDQIIRVIQALKDPRLMDSLKGVFTLRIDVTKQIESTQKEMEKILKALQ
jgi:hypothetical protein